ncbi:MAG: AAA family ATPase [Flavobacteriaceae bacterium]
MNSPYISKVIINNYKNFKDVEVNLNHKQVVIGENNVGKSNFIKAIQLILDRGYSDFDRDLDSSYFHDSIEEPKKNGAEIKVQIEIKNYEKNRHLVSQLSDAVVSINPPTLRITYKYYPLRNEDEEIVDYTYIIYKGDNENNFFTKEDRNFLNIHVIGALRDVERELNAKKRSPLYKLVQEYGIANDDLEKISTSIHTAAEEILNLDEISDIKKVIQNKFETLTGLQHDNELSLSIYDTEIERLLYTIQLYMGVKNRPVSELSLGLANILFISMIMLLLRDKTIPRIIKIADFEKYKTKDSSFLINNYYNLSESGSNYLIIEELLDEEELYTFFNKYNNRPHTVTILAVEEPEAHLHPILQRLIYREILQKSETSVIFTTHSPYITSVAPIDSIVYGKYSNNQTKLYSTVGLTIDINDKIDIERYLDAKRGEIYFGKGVILVEGITEEYMVPQAANLLGANLDDYGIVICNVHSTNFKPYIQILKALNIPWCLITDGDCYKNITSINVDGKEETKKKYHEIVVDTDSTGFRGAELISKTLIDLNICTSDDLEIEGGSDLQSKLSEYNCFIGYYTNEVDTMIKSNALGLEVFKKVYSELRPGGEQQQQNFENELDSKNYWKALKKIDDNISKGRFAQRFASNMKLEMVPQYIQSAITFIVDSVKDNHE